MMRRRSALFVAVGAVAAAVGLARPASAHEEISPRTFPTGQPTFFTLTAANEESANLVKVVLHAPTGSAFGATTRSPAGWTVARTDDTITWMGGAVKPDTFDLWGYEIEGADQPGTLAYKVTLAFADGKTDDVEVDVSAVAPGSTGGPSPTTVTTGAATPGAGSDDKSGDDGDSSTAKAALAVAIVALLAAAGALAVGSRRRAGNGKAGGGRGAGSAPDW